MIFQSTSRLQDGTYRQPQPFLLFYCSNNLVALCMPFKCVCFAAARHIVQYVHGLNQQQQQQIEQQAAALLCIATELTIITGSNTNSTQKDTVRNGTLTQLKQRNTEADERWKKNHCIYLWECLKHTIIHPGC